MSCCGGRREQLRTEYSVRGAQTPQPATAAWYSSTRVRQGRSSRVRSPGVDIPLSDMAHARPSTRAMHRRCCGCHTCSACCVND